MSAKRNRKRTRAGNLPAQVVAKPDTTELELAELAVLMQRLDAAIARDAAGPSAASGRAGGASAGSPAVIDLDTSEVYVDIEAGLGQIAAQAIRLLRLDPPERVIARIDRRINELRAQRASARAGLVKLRAKWIGEQREPTEAERSAGSAALTVIKHCSDGIQQGERRKQLVRTRWSSYGLVSQQLPIWYAELRRRESPLAKHIASDVRSWTRDARRVLNLATAEQSIDWLCPFHRDEPTELRRVADQAVLSSEVLSGRGQHLDDDGIPYTAPLHWRRSQAVYCPACRSKWSGLEAMRILMRMIEQEDAREAEQRDSGVVPARIRLIGPVCTGWFDDCKHESCIQIRDEAPKPVRRRILLLSGPDLARELKRSPQTIRAWAMAGFITKQGRDPWGRTLFDAEEVIGVSDRAQRRRQALSTPDRSSTAVPRGVS